MKHLFVFLVLGLLNAPLLAQSFSPEISLKSGIHRISDYSFNPDYEQQHTVMYEIGVSHSLLHLEKSVLSFGINGSLRREADQLKTYDCLDCPQFDFKGYAAGTNISLQSTMQPVLLGVYSGINLNWASINQTRYGFLPDHIQPEPLITIKETYLNLKTGLRVDIPLHKALYFNSDFRLYFPLDDSDFNQRRTALTAGLSLRL
jgi:hypothetical protein